MLSDAQFGGLHTDLVNNGGFTVAADTGKPVSSGWAVAHHGHEHRTTLGRPPSWPRGPAWRFVSDGGPDELKGYYTAHQDALQQAGHMGGWHEPSSGHVFLDATQITPDSEHGAAAAIAEGYRNKQLSVFNLDRGHTVTMRPGESADLRDARDAGDISPTEAAAMAKRSPSHKAERKETRQAMRLARGPKRASIASMPTSQLGQLFRDRRAF